MRSVIVRSPGHIEIVDIPTPVISPYQALVKTEMVAFCNATDRKLIEGHFPGQDDYPMALGHENVGIVVAKGDKVENFEVGDRVIGGLISDLSYANLHSGWGGFSEYVVVNDFEVLKRNGLATPEAGCWDSFEIQNKVSKTVAPDEAVLACTWREVLGAFKDFNLTQDKKVLIFGAGPVGLSFIKLGRLFGLKQIDAVDISTDKLRLAKEMGADHCFESGRVTSDEFLKEHGASYDTVIDAVGLECIVNSALALVKMGGDVCVYGVITGTPTLYLEKAPYNFNLRIHRWPTRSEEKAAMKPLTEWIEAGTLCASDFISHRYKIDEIEDAFAAIKRGEVIKTVMTF